MRHGPTRVALEHNVLPEVHCWVAMRGPDTIIDTTTGSWPDKARAVGFAWTARNPPSYIWASPRELKDRWSTGEFSPYYHPYKDACEAVDRLAEIEIWPMLRKEI